MSKRDKGITKIEKRINKDWAKMLVKDVRTFEKYYSGLYSELKVRYDLEFEKLQDQSSKIVLLQEFMDEITEANHEIKYNYSISAISEKKESALKGLFKTFESELNGLLLPIVNVQPKEEITFKEKGIGGRKKAIVKNAIDYLQHGTSTTKSKEKFLIELREVYKDCKPLIFNIIIQVLKDKGLLKPATKVEIKKSFESAITQKEIQSQTNFNKYYDIDLKKDSNYEIVIAKVSKIAEGNMLF